MKTVYWVIKGDLKFVPNIVLWVLTEIQIIRKLKNAVVRFR